MAFVVIERFSSHPLLPLRVVMDRNRGGSYLTTLLVGLGMFGAFLFLTYYLQGTLHYSALKTGFAYLPFSFGVIAGAAVSSQLILRLRPRVVMSVGLLMAITGMLWFSQIGVHTGYWTHLFPAEMVMAFGMGMVFVPVNNTALIGVAPGERRRGQCPDQLHPAGRRIDRDRPAQHHRHHRHGVVPAHPPGGAEAAAADAVTAATVHGFAVAFAVAAAILALALVVVATFINAPAGSGGTPDPGEEVHVGTDRCQAGDRRRGLPRSAPWSAAPVTRRSGPFPPAARRRRADRSVHRRDRLRCHTGECWPPGSTTRSSAAPIPSG